MSTAANCLGKREPVSGVHKLARPNDLLASALHDLSSPLAVLKLGIEQLRGPEQLSSERQAYALQRLSRSVERMSELLSALASANGSDDELPLRSEQVDLSELVREIAQSFELCAQRAQCELRLRAPEPVLGLWDSLRLWRIAHNLVSNALQHGKARVVEIAVWRHGGQVLLAVADDGAGLEAWQQRHVFDKHWRGEQARDSPAGHGLGLWIVRRLALELGGDVELQSTPGHGSRFLVRLPNA
jgi:signal transduction histidine kinase